MPVCTMGYSTPITSQNRVWRRSCIRRAPPGHVRPRGSSRPITSSSSAVGAAGLGHVGVDGEREAGRRDHLVDGDAGVHAAQTHAVVGTLEVEDGEVGDDAPELVVLAHPVAELGGAVVADAGHDVDVLHEHLGRVVGDPIARDVLHRVAGRAAHAEQLHLRVRGVADEGEVLVAVGVDLRRAHHHVTAARPHHVEHRAVGVPRLDRLLGVVDAERACRWRRAEPRRRSSPDRVRTRPGRGGRR